MAELRYAYYPGCASQEITKESNETTRKVAGVLGIELHDMPAASCCGAGLVADYDRDLHLALNARNFAQAEEMGMDVLVEVHDEAEREKALEAGSRLIGINNRNLVDFTVDLETTFRLRPGIPDHVPVVSESGITTVEDIRGLREHDVRAALIGESLMRSGVNGTLLEEFVAGG